MRDPKVYYDPDTDTLMVHLSDAPNVGSYEVANGVVVTVDKERRPVAIEFMGHPKDLFAPLIQQFRQGPDELRRPGKGKGSPSLPH
jgi:uncharacterized protein YuzE